MKNLAQIHFVVFEKRKQIPKNDVTEVKARLL